MIDKIFAENLKESLSQVQSYLVWGIGAELSYLVLVTTDLSATPVTV